ncbi:flagellar hook-length control protein FliK [Sinomonas albida]|uniref:flagellar hook-length control protein FliK n=1 Tax=Sinomonas albida TaxID=369942 RepID=UPI0010A831FE|nr:flagellar hook-length control protein FliK [Sinomonas albida]
MSGALAGAASGSAMSGAASSSSGRAGGAADASAGVGLFAAALAALQPGRGAQAGARENDGDAPAAPTAPSSPSRLAQAGQAELLARANDGGVRRAGSKPGDAGGQDSVTAGSQGAGIAVDGTGAAATFAALAASGAGLLPGAISPAASAAATGDALPEPPLRAGAMPSAPSTLGSPPLGGGLPGAVSAQPVAAAFGAAVQGSAVQTSSVPNGAGPNGAMQNVAGPNRAARRTGTPDSAAPDPGAPGSAVAGVAEGARSPSYAVAGSPSLPSPAFGPEAGTRPVGARPGHALGEATGVPGSAGTAAAAAVVRSELAAPGQASMAQPSAAQPATGPTPAPPGFAAQFARPLAGLATLAPGEHVLTLRVTPENLGPVTVQAHIGADGVRLELFAPSDAGRAAVQAVLPDLRRDLAGTGLGATLDLSGRSAPQSHGGRGDGGDPSGRSDGGRSDRGRDGARSARTPRVDGARPSRAAPPARSGIDTSLDILA